MIKLLAQVCYKIQTNFGAHLVQSRCSLYDHFYTNSGVVSKTSQFANYCHYDNFNYIALGGFSFFKCKYLNFAEKLFFCKDEKPIQSNHLLKMLHFWENLPCVQKWSCEAPGLNQWSAHNWPVSPYQALVAQVISKPVEIRKSRLLVVAKSAVNPCKDAKTGLWTV